MFGSDPHRWRGSNAEALEHLLGVDLLRGEAGAQHIVAGRHDLEAQAVQVGVQGPVRDVQRLSRLESDGVQEKRGDHPGVARRGARQAG